ncbi:MAG: AAA family ATPase [Rugosibacter sp.]
MYLDHFGLQEPPFRITPHTEFFFDGANRGATLDALAYAITHDEGIVKVSGEVGSGKTMLCRVLMERLPENTTIIYLANPSLSREDILYAIADELHIELADNARTSHVLRALQNHLITSFSEGRRAVLLIDEAHAMPADTLEEIRLLSNLEANRHKLLQIVLFGQPELNDILARADMRQLKERITHNFDLEPLVRNDIASYLDFRMRAAGYRGPSVFTEAALKMIAKTSLGLTRRINILADKSLLAAFASGSHQISIKEARAAIRDSEFSPATYPHKKISTPLRRSTALAIAALVIAAITLVGITWLVATRQDVATNQTVSAAAPISALPIKKDATNAPIYPAPSTPSKTPATTPYPLTQARLASAEHWLQQTANDRWFIQLWTTDVTQQAEIERFLEKASEYDQDNQLRVYLSSLSGKPRYGIIYGDYPTHEAALKAKKLLPDMLAKNNPYPRQVIRLR